MQRLLALQVVQQGLLFLDGLLPPGLDVLGALHHLGGLGADKAAVRGMRADLGGLHAVRPVRLLPARLRKARDFALQARVLLQLELVARVAVEAPGAVVALLHLDALAVEGEDVVAGAVEQRAVVRDEDEPLLRRKIRLQ